MSRKRLIRDSKLPYHVRARANNGEWFQLPLEEVWDVFDRYLKKIQDLFDVRIHAFVLMSNHFHLLMTTPRSNLDEAMEYFLRESSKTLNRSSGRENHLFGGPYKWTLIEKESYFYHAVKYVYLNPVKARLCARAEDYPFSSLNGLPRRYPTTNACFGPGPSIAAINQAYSEQENDCIRRALRRTTFRFSPHRVTRKLPELFTQR
jgi:putative transposase